MSTKSIERGPHTNFKPGQRTLPAQDLNAQQTGNIRNISGGPGVNITKTGDSVIVSARPSSGRGVSGASGPRVVTELPAIPEEYGVYDQVIWAGPEHDGTGDDQVWEVVGGQEEWSARQRLTTLSGVPE